MLCFAAESRKLYFSGCMKVANGALAADFFHFGADDFLLKIPNKTCFKIVFFLFSAYVSRSGFGAPVCAKFYCVSQLSLCRSQLEAGGG